ncbi:MAG TPA: hypothetical protein DHV36_05065, partial [Desulfobacteraceae bacterium]|nr:hypothetical protein [Desulfobacteraceae bacterium]
RARGWLNRFPKKRFRFPPAIFVIVPEGATDEFRVSLMEEGFDEAVGWPLTPREFAVRSRVYIRQTQMAQKHHADSESLARAFGYLDRFKNEVRQLKADLMEEKTSLNAALKQIQQMTAERGRLKDDLAGLKQQLAKNMQGFGRILYTLIQKRIEVNQGHGERVAETACFLAKALGIDENKLEDLRKAAMLHEVGLLFLSDPPAAAHSRSAASRSAGEKDAACDQTITGQATSNNHQPTAYDKTIMMQYPVKGAELLDACPGFDGCAKIIKSLNEWSDGTGYPDGLKRRFIPMTSRILAGADELENLRDRADIRDTRTLLAAMEDLAGVRLDPVIVGQLEKYVVRHMGADDFKVRGVRIDQLEPGMELGAALFTATGTKLFTANTVLTKDAIDKIIQYNREYPVDETVYIKV